MRAASEYDKFFDVEELKPYYNETEEEAIRTYLSKTDEWLEDEGTDASVEEYTARLGNLTKLTDAIWQKKRLDEAKKKPKESPSSKKKPAKSKAKRKSGKKSSDDDDDDDDDEKDDKKGTRDEL